MNSMLGRREFLGSVAALSLLGGCKVGKVAGNAVAATDGGALGKALQGVAEAILGEFPEQATILGIAKDRFAPLAHQLHDQTPAGVAARKAGSFSFVKPPAVLRKGCIDMRSAALTTFEST